MRREMIISLRSKIEQSRLVMTEKEDYLEVYTMNCLKCSHLVEGAQKTFSKCHFTNGNDHCPAQEVGIVVTGKVHRAVQQIRKARERKDPLTEARILEEMAKEGPAVKHRFYDLLD